MEESKKKVIMTGIIVVCFGLAAVMAYKYTIKPKLGGGTGEFKGQLMWVKCGNPDCETEYQMDKEGYFDALAELRRKNPVQLQVSPLVCEKCGEESVYRAEKCGKCGVVFFRGAAGRGEFSDKCPECGYSKQEEVRKEAREKAAEGG